MVNQGSLRSSSSNKRKKESLLPSPRISESRKSTWRLTSRIAEESTPQQAVVAPLISNYDDHRIRPLLDAVDKLRHLNVMKEGIQLPIIVVVGDQSSGKSSVLESLSGINLPRGQGICTRVPLIMRLQNYDSLLEPQLRLEYLGKVIPTDEIHVCEAISNATEEIAGNGKCISNTPLTLVVNKKGVPDLTMVDLPGITRVPVHGQPEDIYEQINNMIMEYISPKANIILNVLSATVDFPTCESIRLSRRVDKTGERTLAVVTKVDKSPETLLEKVTADDVNIGLGYVCLRNRIGDETYEEARIEEARLFNSNQLLSKIDKCIVGVPVLTQKLVQIQEASISKFLPDVVKMINEKLNQNLSELNNIPLHISSTPDVMTAFVRFVGSAKESLKKILIYGEVEEEYAVHESNIPCRGRLAKLVNRYSAELELKSRDSCTENFLMEEIKVLEETKGIELPNFLPRTAFLTILQRRVNQVAEIPVKFAEEFWSYVEDMFIRVFVMKSDSNPELQSFTRWAAPNMMRKVRNRSIDRVKEILEMEKMADYTWCPDYKEMYCRLMQDQQHFTKVISGGSRTRSVYITTLGSVDVGHLKDNSSAQQAFDIKMRLMAYWKIVLRRLADNLALHLLYSVQNLVNKEMEVEMVNALMGVAAKRDKLSSSIKLLTDSKEAMAKIMDVAV